MLCNFKDTHEKFVLMKKNLYGTLVIINLCSILVDKILNIAAFKRLVNLLFMILSNLRN